VEEKGELSSSWINKEIYRIAVQEETPSIRDQHFRYVNNLLSFGRIFESKNDRFTLLTLLKSSHFPKTLPTISRFLKETSKR
jgi:hypothetical protein